MGTKRIFVIEDDDGANEAIRAALSSLPVELLFETEANQAFSRLKKEEPDAVVVAVELSPQKQGYNLCRKIKKSLKHLPVLMISVGDPYLEDHKKLTTRADEYLLKPFSAEDFVSKIEKLTGPLGTDEELVTEDIIDLDSDESMEATIVADVVETIGDDDIVEESNVSQAPVAQAAPPAAQAAPAEAADAPFGAVDEENFDAMLESLEFHAEAPSAPRELDRLSPPPERGAQPVLTDTVVSQTIDRTEDTSVGGGPTVAELDARLQEALNLAIARKDRIDELQAELTDLKGRLSTLESAAAMSDDDVVEELEARDRELTERTKQFEALADRHEKLLEQMQTEHADALAKAQAEAAAEQGRLEGEASAARKEMAEANAARAEAEKAQADLSNRLSKALERLKAEEKRRDKLKKAAALLVELLEQRE